MRRSANRGFAPARRQETPMTHRIVAPFQSDALPSRPAAAGARKLEPRAARLSRRSLFKLGGGVAAGLALSSALPFGDAFVGEAHAAGFPYSAYHGVTGADHQARFNTLSQQGYRPISLSVYRTTEGVRYAAIWAMQSGPAWYAFHGLSGSAYQSKFDEMTGQGF